MFCDTEELSEGGKLLGGMSHMHRTCVHRREGFGVFSDVPTAGGLLTHEGSISQYENDMQQNYLAFFDTKNYRSSCAHGFLVRENDCIAWQVCVQCATYGFQRQEHSQSQCSEDTEQEHC